MWTMATVLPTSLTHGRESSIRKFVVLLTTAALFLTRSIMRLIKREDDQERALACPKTEREANIQ